MKKSNKTLFTKPANTEEKQSQCLFFSPGKHFLFIIAISLVLALQITNNLEAQGSLQFNQVIIDSVYAKVPANKVWKVEAIFGARTTSSGGSGNDAAGHSLPSMTQPSPTLPAVHSIKINGHEVDIASQVSLGTGAGAGGSYTNPEPGTSTSDYYIAISDYSFLGVDYCTNLPFWLSAGNSLAPSTNVYAISIIEFNIIPSLALRYKSNNFN